MKIKTKYSLSFSLFISSLLIAVFALSACSAISGGAKDSRTGSIRGEISDEDLALSQSRFGDGNIPEAREGGLFDDVHFEFDSSTVRAEYHSALEENARALQADSTLRVQVEGHCDNRGTSEYNMALGERRALAARAFLVQWGIEPGRIQTRSFGKENQLHAGSGESARRLNRRAEFVMVR